MVQFYLKVFALVYVQNYHCTYRRFSEFFFHMIIVYFTEWLPKNFE